MASVFRAAFEHRFSLGGHGRIALHREHPLLADRRDRRAGLFFCGSSDDPERLIETLTAAHARFVEGWRPLERYLNANVPLVDLLAGPGGRLAMGPTSVLAVHKAVLNAHGIATTVLDVGPAKRWDDELHEVDVVEDLGVVLFTDWQPGVFPEPASYVVAADIDVRQVQLRRAG